MDSTLSFFYNAALESNGIIVITYIKIMKTKFLLLAVTAVAFIFSGCEKENIIDLTNIKAEVKLQCVDKEYFYSGDNSPECTFVCSGYIGGFTGPASIKIKPTALMISITVI